MTGYLLETGPLAGYFNGREGAGKIVDSLLRQSTVKTSGLCYGEVVEYLQEMPNANRRNRELRELLLTIKPVGLSYRVLEKYARIRRELRQQRLGLIGDVDTLIAATAFENGLILVTTDRDFLRVPDLKYMLLEPRTFAILEQTT